MPQRLTATGHALWAPDEALSTRDDMLVSQWVFGMIGKTAKPGISAEYPRFGS